MFVIRGDYVPGRLCPREIMCEEIMSGEISFREILDVGRVCTMRLWVVIPCLAST